jgi:hypothetical protein
MSGASRSNPAPADEEQTMPLTVIRDGAGPAIMNLKAVFELLPRDIDVAELLHRISRKGERAQLVLRDGTHATLQSLSYEADPADPPGQRALILLPPTVREFDLEVKLLFEIEGLVTCQAADKKAAVVKVGEMFEGTRPFDGTVNLFVEREQLGERFLEIDRALAAGDLSGLVTRDVIINRIEER